MSEIPEDVMKAADAVMEEIIVFSYAPDARERIAYAILAERNTNAQIHNLLYEALELDGASLDILQIVGSLNDTQPAHATLEQLQAFIEREKNRSGEPD